MWLLLAPFREADKEILVSFPGRLFAIRIIIVTNCSKTVPWCRYDSSRTSSSSLLPHKVKYLGSFSLFATNLALKRGAAKQEILLKLIFTAHVCVSVGDLREELHSSQKKNKNKKRITGQQLNSKRWAEAWMEPSAKRPHAETCLTRPSRKRTSVHKEDRGASSHSVWRYSKLHQLRQPGGGVLASRSLPSPLLILLWVVCGIWPQILKIPAQNK